MGYTLCVYPQCDTIMSLCIQVVATVKYRLCITELFYNHVIYKVHGYLAVVLYHNYYDLNIVLLKAP